MSQTGHHEGDERSDRLRRLTVHLGLHVHMTQTPVVNGPVPLLPELLRLINAVFAYEHGLGISPVLVEKTVAEHGHLGEDVQEAVEDGEEEQEPDDEPTVTVRPFADAESEQRKMRKIMEVWVSERIGYTN